MREIKFKIWTGGHMLRSEDYPCFPFYIGATDDKRNDRGYASL